ncbi:BrnA antitoxin family protein [Bradyrhizobium sp. CCGUVB23]|uniref:BrnA antitoxin family protein n=1 Tax=Bradyrhizobium sp. CCGUVB23 TaxID=2949630 RepID=UPI00353222B9
MKIIWDEPKRLANLGKHGMDFADLNEKFFDTAVVLEAKRDRYRAIGVNIRDVISRCTARRPSASSACAQPVKQKGSSMKRIVAKKRYTASDMRAVSDNPEWTNRDFAKAKAIHEVFPTMRKGRGPNKASTKNLVSRRLSPVVLDHFKAGGPNWQSRIDEALVKIVKRKAG